MNRNDKITALRQVLQGEPINKVFPSVRILIVENFTDTHSFILGNVGYKLIPSNQVEEYVLQVKQDNPLKRLDVDRISRQEYDRINDKLESEY